MDEPALPLLTMFCFRAGGFLVVELLFDEKGLSPSPSSTNLGFAAGGLGGLVGAIPVLVQPEEGEKQKQKKTSKGQALSWLSPTLSTHFSPSC